MDILTLFCMGREGGGGKTVTLLVFLNSSKIVLILPAPIPDKEKKIYLNFILIQLSEMHGTGRVNIT